MKINIDETRSRDGDRQPFRLRQLVITIHIDDDDNDVMLHKINKLTEIAHQLALHK